MAASAASSTQDKDPDSGLESTASVSSLSSSVNEQVENTDLERKKRLFYEGHADGTFHFADGRSIQFCRPVLAGKSDHFHELLYDKGLSEIKIEDFDADTFKLFLDCVMKFKSPEIGEVLIIIPLAFKYGMKKYVEKWSKMLVFKDLSEDVCLTLNLSIYYKLQGLVRSTISLLSSNGRVNRLLEDEKYYSLLEPESMVKILECVRMDSYIVQKIEDWGNCYLKKSGKALDLKTLLDSCGIIKKITLDCFESINCLLDFVQTDLCKSFFNTEDVVRHFSESDILPQKSEWVKIKSGEVLTEEIVFRNVVISKDVRTGFSVSNNHMVFYGGGNDNEALVSAKLKFNFEIRNKKNDMNWINIINDIISPKFATCLFGGRNFYAKQNDLANPNETHVVPRFAVIIEYTFNTDCRVLKTSYLNKSFSYYTDNSGLYLTSNVTCNYSSEVWIPEETSFGKFSFGQSKPLFSGIGTLQKRSAPKT